MHLEFRFVLARRGFQAAFEGRAGDGITAVFGASGAGKTTLLHLLCGLIHPREGYLAIDGTPLLDTRRGVFVPPHRRGIGMVFQDLRLFPHLDVRRNLLYGARGKGLQDDLVDLLGLGALLAAAPAELSGGEQQRVALGRALLADPRLLLLDEPFSAVDRERRLQILPYLRAIHTRRKLPMIVVSHDLPDLLRLTEQLLVVEGGAVAAQGSLTDLLRHPSFLGQVRGSSLLNRFPVRCTHETEGAAHLQSTCPDGRTGPDLVGPAVPPGCREHPFFATLAPTEVILARQAVEAVSMRNQLPGTVVDVVARGDEVLCVVDAGVRVLAEITPASCRRLGLKPGAPVYCLFKAHALCYSL